MSSEQNEVARLQSLFMRLSAGGADSEAAAIEMIGLLEDPTSLFTQAFERTRHRLSQQQRDLLDDTLAVARARVDCKASIEYWLRDEEGKPIRLTTLQKFYIDFFELGHSLGLIPIIFGVTGSGKTSVLRGLIAYEVGRNVNILEQLICATDPQATKRGLALRQLLESPHYQKVFPNVKKNQDKWAAHEMLVQRTLAEGEIRADSRGDAGAVDPTIACYSAFGGGLGSRAHCSNFDDIATEKNSIFEKDEGERLHQLLIGTWLPRKKIPFGKSDQEYTLKDNPWKARIIGTPWATDDPVYRLRTWEGAAVALVGVNSSLTAYNVQIWGVTAEQMEPIRKAYCEGTVEFSELPEEMREWCESQAIPTETTYTLGSGRVLDRMSKPTATMELPFTGIPRLWYLNELKQASNKDPKMFFWRPYGCQVFDIGDLAYPGFANSCFTHYPEYKDIDGKPNRPMIVEKVPIRATRGDVHDMIIGWRAMLLDRPTDGKNKIVTIDLSGMQRMGVVLHTAELTPQYRRRPIEITRAGFAPEEISDQISDLYERHPDLVGIYIESVSLQKIYVREMIKHKETYPWWHLVASWEDAAISKNDAQLGILAMGTSFSNGGFEIANTWDMHGHGELCPCGFCVLISDAVRQPRLSKVTSDLLVTTWGIHRKMPINFDIPEGEPPTGYTYVRDGYALMAEPPPFPKEEDEPEIEFDESGEPKEKPDELEAFLARRKMHKEKREKEAEANLL